MEKIKLSQFVGRQLARLKAGQTVIIMATSSITALGVMNFAFPGIDTGIIILLLLSIVFGAYIIGCIMDRSNIITTDYQKSIEMTQRYLTILDKKNYEFRLMELRILRKWLIAMKDNKPLEEGIIDEEYNKFSKNWNPPKKN